MTLRNLRLFVEVYKTENITKAAENLNMTQPTVTRAIHELEEYYNTQFFDRINKRLYITDAGRRFYHFASQTLESYEIMEKNMQDWEHSRTIRIGATNSIGSILLPKLIPIFKKAHPNITVKSLISNANLLNESLENNDLDFALIEGGVHNENLIAEPFYQDSLVLLLPPDDPLSKLDYLTLEDIKEASFLLREKGHIGRTIIDNAFSMRGLILEPVMESASTHALVQSVHAGIGISILPENLVKYSIQSGFVSTNTLQDVPLMKQDYLVWHKGKYLSKSVRELMKLCKEASASI